jgi:hypothetical protein
LHGTPATVELSVHVLACVAAGRGMRATARGFEVDANTGRQGLVEAAAQRQACSAYVLGDVHVRQRPRDELSAVLRSVKDGESSAAQAIQRLERSRHWVWTAIDPESTLLLTIEGGPRPLAIAQRVGHQVVGVLAPGWVPVWLRAGVKGSLPAMVGHCGDWRHPERRPDNGPWPKPRWMPRPGLRYAQGIKQYRRKRLVGVKHPVVCGPLGTIAQV